MDAVIESFEYCSAIVRDALHTPSGQLRHLFDIASVRLEAFSKPSRSPVEEPSKDSRRGLEQVSKRIRRRVEQTSKKLLF